MIRDLEDSPDESTIACDVCIVGAGAAGLTVAHQLARSRLGVVVLESGGAGIERESQELLKGDSSGWRYTGHYEGRARALGGTTNLWGGQILPLSPNDFRPRPWIPHSGWPISYDSLAPFYDRAAALLKLDEADYSAGLAKRLGATLPAFQPAALETFFSKWLRRPQLWDVLGETIQRAPNVTVMLHANVTELRLGEDSRVESLICRSLGGKRMTVQPRVVVLATGALEVVRLLLASRSCRPAGIGNEHDLVGRFLQDHPGGALGTVQPRDDVATQSMFNVHHRGGLRYTVRFALTPALQERHGVASASGSLMFFPRPDSGFVAAKALYRALQSGRVTRASLTHLGKAAAELPTLVRSVASFARGRVYTPAASVRLMGSFEQEPNPDSRVTLSPERDALGVPRLRIHWQLTDLTHRTIRVFAETAKSQLQSLGVGGVALEPWVTSLTDDWKGKVGDHYHQMGTARMSGSPREGVVNPDCRLHSVENVYVASAAVFPTSGHSNPTFSVIALAIRLADRLKSALQHAPAL